MNERETPGRVLVGVDGSEDGLRATRYGVGRAKRLDLDLWLVHALDDGVVAGGWGVIYDPGVLEQSGQAVVQQAVDLALARGLPRQRVHTSVLVGHPAVVLEELSHQAETMILGRRSATGLERMFVGSTSTSLAATAGCPLVVISSASTPEPTGSKRRVSVAIGTGRSEKALRWGCQEAVDRQSVLDVIHVIPPQASTALALVSPPSQAELVWEGRVKEELERRVKPLRQEFPDLVIETHPTVGNPIDQLIAQTQISDLLILSVRSRPITGIALGGPVRGVLAHAASPVALIR
ncbi:MAG: universal stress protein [Propionibacteriaceae bacterium]|jgi:nucleotide-binding universal stress UspA family protein|nr:universal stress protein [Propionibacteriaceae bacterium]